MTKDKKSRRLNQVLYESNEDQRGIQFENLVRLGLIETNYSADGMKVLVRPGHNPFVSGEMDENHWLTDFSIAFIEACRAPKVIDAQ